jgi:Tfp pilus assembly protein PilN
MKEIDFLPEWYKETRRREMSVRRQYFILGAIFAAMISYNLFATHAISKAAVELSRAEPSRAQAEDTLYELNKIKSQIVQLQKKAKSFEQMDSKINVAAVLAEMSFIIDKSIVLRQIEFAAEPLSKPGKGEQNQSSAVRVVGTTPGAKSQQPGGDVRFKIVISGVAADASDVAALFERLENSQYFHQVYLSISKNTKLQVGTKALPEIPRGDTSVIAAKTHDNFQASEFEISCYLANYNEVKS